MKRMKKFLSLLCAGLVLCGSFGGLGVQASEPAETSENTTQVRYRPGYIRTLYPTKYHDPVKLPVLYDQEKDTVLVNPEAFFGIFPNYSYTFDQEDRSGEIWLYNRRMAFHAGSDVTAYKISGCEGFFSMSTEAVLWKKQLWVPAKDLLYYLGCQVLPLSITLEETYKPKEDLLVVGDPAYTLLDALADLFKENNGQNWMFSFAKDFGFTSMDQFKLAASAVVADSLYGTVTLDLDTILSWGTQPFTDFYNNIVKLSNTFFDTEWKETGSWYDGKFMRKFLTAMQQPMEEQSDSIAELSDNLAGSILPIISVYADDVKEHLVNSPEQLAELINNWTWDGKYFNVFKDSIEEFEKTNESYKKLSDTLSDGSETLGTMATAAYFILSGFEILDQTKNMDQQMMEAMDRYISASKEHSLMPETARSALDTQYALLKSQIAFSMSEVTSNAYNKLIPDFALDALGTGYSLVPTMTKMLWSVFEENQSFLPKVEEPEAMQFATYGMYYESDALGNQEGRRIILEGENRLIAELYSMDENGEIFLAGRQALGSYSGLTGEWLAAGITEIDGTTYLYTESYSNALFANGFYLGYDFYEYTKDGAFRPCMSVCKSDGGSSGIAYSVLQREGEEKWRKTVLQGDGEFRMYTEDKIFFNEDISVRIALDYGFSVLGFPATLNDMELYSEYPTYMENEELIEPLFHLLCQGDNGNGGWSIHTEVKEQSDFRWVMKMLFGDENDAPDTVPGRPFPNTTTTS